MRTARAAVLAAIGLALTQCPAPVLAHGPVDAIQIGSTSDGGGALATFFHFHQREGRLAYSTTLLTTSIYTGELPAFESLEADDAPDVFVLDPGTPVSLEITDIQGSVQVTVGVTTLDSVGDSAVIGAEPIGHTHPEWTLLLDAPAGAFGEGSISFKFTTTSMAYSESEIYTVKLTNGPLSEAEFDTAEFDKAAVACRQAVGKGAQKFLDKKLSLMRKCVDKIEVVEAMEALTVPPSGLSKAEAKAEATCVGEAGTPAEKTMLGKIDAAQTKAAASIAKKCAASLSSEDIDQNLNFVSCRAEEMIAATYGNAKTTMSEYTAQASQGGLALDRYFPCLHLMLAH